MLIAGVDEVGRGPLAGPVITAAVIMEGVIDGVTDSKLLSDKKRRQLAETIKQHVICYAYGRAEVDEIDRFNIHHATLLAMKRAIEGLAVAPGKIYVDGLFVPHVTIPCEAVVKGDSTIMSIGAASILAKVMRDDEMIAMDDVYQGYGFASHKGYATREHKMALFHLGPCAIHRKSFSPVAYSHV